MSLQGLGSKELMCSHPTEDGFAVCRTLVCMLHGFGKVSTVNARIATSIGCHGQERSGPSILDVRDQGRYFN